MDDDGIFTKGEHRAQPPRPRRASDRGVDAMKSKLSMFMLLVVMPGAPALAQDAGLQVQFAPVRDPSVAVRNSAGPLALSMRTRRGNFAGVADYGSVRASVSGRVVSITDRSWDGRSSAQATMGDTIVLNDPFGGANPGLYATFRLTGTSSVSARVASTSTGTLGTANTEMFLVAGVDGFTPSSFSVFEVVRDTVRTTPVRLGSTSFGTGDIPFMRNPRFTGGPVSTLMIDVFFQYGVPVNLFLGASCGINLTSYSELDSNTGACRSSLHLDGLVALTDLFGNSLDPVSFNAVGMSGFNWFAPATAPSMMRLSAAPVPEPGTWAMMIAGFGLIGGMARWRHGSPSRAIA